MDFFGIDLSRVIFFAILLISALGLLAVVGPMLKGRSEEKWRDKIGADLNRKGYDLLDFNVDATSTLAGFDPDRSRDDQGDFVRTTFEAFVRDRETGERDYITGRIDYGGHFVYTRGEASLSKKSQRPRTLLQVEEQERERAQQMTSEQRRAQEINQEVARRLDTMTNSPEVMMQFDTNSDGQIDSAEWEEVRRKMRARVEKEWADKEAQTSNASQGSGSEQLPPDSEGTGEWTAW